METGLSAKAAATKKKIIDAAMALLIKKGYPEMTLREIARNAGVTTGAFYRYFNSKDEILYSIFSEGFKREWSVWFDLEENFTIGDYIEMDARLNRGLAKTFGYELLGAYYFAQCNMEDFTSIWELIDDGKFLKKDRELLESLARRYETKYTGEEIDNLIFKVDRGGFWDWIMHKGSYDVAEANRELMTVAFKGIFPGWDGK